VIFNLLDNAANTHLWVDHPYLRPHRSRSGRRGCDRRWRRDSGRLARRDLQQFTRLQAGDKKRAGTGLGLPICRASWSDGGRSSPEPQIVGRIFTIRSQERSVPEPAAKVAADVAIPQILVVDDELRSVACSGPALARRNLKCGGRTAAAALKRLASRSSIWSFSIWTPDRSGIAVIEECERPPRSDHRTFVRTTRREGQGAGTRADDYIRSHSEWELVTVSCRASAPLSAQGTQPLLHRRLGD